MKNWKVIIEHKGRVVEIKIEARYYSDAYLEASKKYPGCVVKSISQIRDTTNKTE
jgi:hypothetical protein